MLFTLALLLHGEATKDVVIDEFSFNLKSLGTQAYFSIHYNHSLYIFIQCF